MKYKILVVDDDKELVKMLCSYFNMKQYETITATDGMEALNKIKMKPDIILLDINMPRMDGIEVCRLIRSKVLCPILFLTARVDEDDKINGLLSGGDDYITKPFSLRELEARIVTNIKREERHHMKVIHLISGGDSGGAKTHVLSLLQNLNKTITAQLVCFRDGPFA